MGSKHKTDNETRRRPDPLLDLEEELRVMTTFTDWLPMAMVGLTFTLLGCVKLWGLRKGIVGGGGKPVVLRLCGT